jgi:hypothetical protein
VAAVVSSARLSPLVSWCSAEAAGAKTDASWLALWRYWSLSSSHKGTSQARAVRACRGLKVPRNRFIAACFRWSVKELA